VKTSDIKHYSGGYSVFEEELMEIEKFHTLLSLTLNHFFNDMATQERKDHLGMKPIDYNLVMLRAWLERITNE